MLRKGKDLNHMPNATPCISREDWSHDFNKSVQRGSVKIN